MGSSKAPRLRGTLPATRWSGGLSKGAAAEPRLLMKDSRAKRLQGREHGRCQGPAVGKGTSKQRWLGIFSPMLIKRMSSPGHTHRALGSAPRPPLSFLAAV